MDGVGRRMPWTMAAFTVGALGMIGLPPLAGFISKWYLGLGGLAAGQPWIILVLIAAAPCSTPAIFYRSLHRIWFVQPRQDWSPLAPCAAGVKPPGRLLAPPLITAILVIVLGLLAHSRQPAVLG
jgi:multicomponent Na+:H+ antiporter subunit D